MIASATLEAALCFFKAFKVYPAQSELMNIYDKTVPKVSGGWSGCGAMMANALAAAGPGHSS